MLPGIFGTGIRIGANLLLLPLVIRKLSLSEFALWMIFDALGAFGNLADFGFGSTIPRIYNYLWAGAEDFEAEGLRPAKMEGKPNLAGISRVSTAVRSLYLKISLAAAGLLAIGGSISMIKPATESGRPGEVWLLWAVFIVAVSYNLATFHWVLALQGLNRMRELQMVYIWGGLSYALCAAILLCCHMGLASMVIATFLKGFIMHGRCRQIFRQIVPEPAQREAPDPHILRKLWPNSYKFGVIAISGYCLSKASVVICGDFLGKEVTASVGLTAQIGSYLTGFASLWLVVKWPEIAILRTQGRLVEMAVLFARRLTLVMLSFVGMALVVFFAGNAVLAWMGKDKRLLEAPYLAFYLFYLTYGIFYMQLGMFAFTENVVPLFKVNLLMGLGVIAGSLILTRFYGLWGLLGAPFVGSTIYGWFMARRGFQGQPLSKRQFVLAALGGQV
jgi:O-antigen/teichoic acid export membrane protein